MFYDYSWFFFQILSFLYIFSLYFVHAILENWNLSIYLSLKFHIYMNILYMYIPIYTTYCIYILKSLVTQYWKGSWKENIVKESNNLFFGYTNLWVIWHKKHLKAHNCYKSLLTLQSFWNFLILSQQTWKIFPIIWLIMFQNLAEAILKFCIWCSNINSRRYRSASARLRAHSTLKILRNIHSICHHLALTWSD